MASRAAIFRPGIPVNARLQSLIRMMHAVENRIYRNEATAVQAKCLMNAVGTILQEIPLLLDKADKEHDGHSYILFDLGKPASALLSRQS